MLLLTQPDVVPPDFPVSPEQLVDMSFVSTEELVTWLVSLGIIVTQEHGVLNLSNPTLRFSCRIFEDMEPVSRVIPLATVLAGPYQWPDFYQSLPERVEREHQRRLWAEVNGYDPAVAQPVPLHQGIPLPPIQRKTSRGGLIYPAQPRASFEQLYREWDQS